MLTRIAKTIPTHVIQYLTAGLRVAGLKQAVINSETKTKEILDNT
jgi:hypothetical protein